MAKPRITDCRPRVLGLLLERPGELITRDELREALWPPGTFVDFDHGLNAAVRKLRDALGDSGTNPRFIETLARRGYRFIAPVDRSAIVATEQKIMLAVLPFESRPMTEEMVTRLGGLHPRLLGVIARTSVMRYKDSNRSIARGMTDPARSSTFAWTPNWTTCVKIPVFVRCSTG